MNTMNGRRRFEPVVLMPSLPPEQGRRPAPPPAAPDDDAADAQLDMLRTAITSLEAEIETKQAVARKAAELAAAAQARHEVGLAEHRENVERHAQAEKDFGSASVKEQPSRHATVALTERALKVSADKVSQLAGDSQATAAIAASAARSGADATVMRETLEREAKALEPATLAALHEIVDPLARAFLQHVLALQDTARKILAAGDAHAAAVAQYNRVAQPTTPLQTAGSHHLLLATADALAERGLVLSDPYLASLRSVVEGRTSDGGRAPVPLLIGGFGPLVDEVLRATDESVARPSAEALEQRRRTLSAARRCRSIHTALDQVRAEGVAAKALEDAARPQPPSPRLLHPDAAPLRGGLNTPKAPPRVDMLGDRSGSSIPRGVPGPAPSRGGPPG